MTVAPWWLMPSDLSPWMDGRRRILAFTGHRPDKLGGYKPNPVYHLVVDRLYHVLSQLKPHLEYVVSGMALGVDQWAAEIALDLGIDFVAAVPFPGQDNRWPEESRAHYRALLEKAMRIEMVSPRYSGGAMQVRNQWMVKNSDLLLAVYNGDQEGGTYNCVEYAHRIAHKPILYIFPYARAP